MAGAWCLGHCCFQTKERGMPYPDSKYGQVVKYVCGLPCDLCDTVVTNITSRPVMTYIADGKQRQVAGKVICQRCARTTKEKSDGND